MNKKIKTILMLFVLCALFSIICTSKVDAASIVFDDNDNPDYVTVLSLNDETFTIEIDDESKIGYVVKNVGDSNLELGTCKVTVINYDNKETYLLCSDIKENSLGEMIITISNGVSTVTYINGEIETVVELYSAVEILE